MSVPGGTHTPYPPGSTYHPQEQTPNPGNTQPPPPPRKELGTRQEMTSTTPPVNGMTDVSEHYLPFRSVITYLLYVSIWQCMEIRDVFLKTNISLLIPSLPIHKISVIVSNTRWINTTLDPFALLSFE